MALTVLVANRKGGCGKTTVATTLAAAFAAEGLRVALADADRQRSALDWAARRPAEAAPVQALDWSRGGVGERPKKLDVLVIDAPGALRGAAAEALIAEAGAVVLPVAPSAFDQEATRRFLERIEAIKRVRKGRAAVHLLANRIRPRARASEALTDWLVELGRPPAAIVGDRAAYADLAAEGLSVFDRSGKAWAPLQAQWTPLMSVVRRE